jgi:formylglycine-generating enzyme required for sulfatase activity
LGRWGFVLFVPLAVALSITGGVVLQSLRGPGRSSNPGETAVGQVPQGSFELEPLAPVFLPRGEQRLVPLRIRRTNFRDPIAITTDWVTDEDTQVTFQPSDGARGGDDTETVNLLVKAESAARTGTTDKVEVIARSGSVERRQRLQVTVLFLPARGGTGPQAETLTDSEGKSFYTKFTWSTPGLRTPVQFALIPRQRDSDPRTFYMMVDKVSVGLFREFAGSAEGKDKVPPEGQERASDRDKDRKFPGWNPGKKYEADYPVFGVTFPEAQLFAKWMGGDVPTTEQWDKAAGFNEWDGKDELAGPFQGRWNGDKPLDIAVGKARRPRPVGGLSLQNISNFGCRDMAGNGDEWTRTPRDPDYPQEGHRLRGRSFERLTPLLFKYVKQSGSGVAEVGDAVPSESFPDLGFRVVIEPK